MKQRFILMILFIAFFTVSTVEAQNKALNNACVYYASLAGSTLKGRIVADILSGFRVGKMLRKRVRQPSNMVPKSVSG